MPLAFQKKMILLPSNTEKLQGAINALMATLNYIVEQENCGIVVEINVYKNGSRVAIHTMSEETNEEEDDDY